MPINKYDPAEARRIKQKELSGQPLESWEKQYALDSGTGNNQTVGDVLMEAKEKALNTIQNNQIPPEQQKGADLSDLYNSRQERDLYNQKYQEAKNRIPSPSGDEYKAIVENARRKEAEMLASEKEEADRNKQESALAYQRMVERDRQEREQEAKRQALQNMMAGKK